MNSIILSVDDDLCNIRIDKYLAEVLEVEDYSRSFIQKLIKDEGVLVEGKPVKTNYKVSSGEEIRLLIPEPILPEIVAEETAEAALTSPAITAQARTQLMGGTDIHRIEHG